MAAGSVAPAATRAKPVSGALETAFTETKRKKAERELVLRAIPSRRRHDKLVFALSTKSQKFRQFSAIQDNIPDDTLCDSFGPEREHPLNKPCTGLVVHSDPKARSTLKSVNGNTAPSCRTSAPPDRVPESCQSAKLLATYWMGEWVDFRLGTGAPTADFEPPANCLPFWPYRRQREPDDLV